MIINQIFSTLFLQFFSLQSSSPLMIFQSSLPMVASYSLCNYFLTNTSVPLLLLQLLLPPAPSPSMELPSFYHSQTS
ncbi:hypothetical protein Hanom_Chr14g01247871 [Helianthus anomalus]